jgi:lysyl-tRNA synthetase class 1
MVRYAVVYFRDFVAPKKRYREADEVERDVLMAISSRLSQLPANASADEIQHALYDIARPIPRYQDHSAKGATAARPGVSNEFFNMVYAVLLGESQGPRFGSFIAIYGLEETRNLIDKALAGELFSETQKTRGSLDATALSNGEDVKRP